MNRKQKTLKLIEEAANFLDEIADKPLFIARTIEELRLLDIQALKNKEKELKFTQNLKKNITPLEKELKTLTKLVLFNLEPKDALNFFNKTFKTKTAFINFHLSWLDIEIKDAFHIEMRRNALNSLINTLFSKKLSNTMLSVCVFNIFEILTALFKHKTIKAVTFSKDNDSFKAIKTESLSNLRKDLKQIQINISEVFSETRH